ncbi:MAG: AAA domain-containing protein, partial [Candidatus Methanoperedens sp.]
MKDPKKLIEFYIECIEKEEINQLTLDKKDLGKKFLIDVLNKEQFFNNNIEQVSIPLINKIHKDFFKKLTPNNHLFYGYPLFLTNKNRISPVFFTELIFESKNDILTIIKMSVTPEFNHYILKNRGLTDEEINLNREKIDQMDNFQNKLNFISRLIGTNCVFSQDLSNEKLLVPMGSEFFIHNKSIIYFGERTGYTWGLLKELDWLKKMQTNRLMSTSLNYLFNPNELINQKNNGEIKPILNIFPLNLSQSEAVHNAFLKKITVVTGPPGTGKSQVVLNILANAVWNNNVVLFASRNNQAVNVVWEKMSKIIPSELIMRMGSGEYRKQTKTSLIELLKNRCTICENIHDVEKLQKELDIKNSAIEEIKSKINEMSKINKSIEDALINIEIFSKTLPSELIEICGKIPINLDILELKNDISIISSESSFFIKLLKLIFPGYFRKKEYQIFRKYYDGLNLEYKKFFDKNLQPSDFEILKGLNWLLAITQISASNEEINASKSKLKHYSSLFNYLNQIKTIENEKVPISGEILKNFWLNKISQIEPTNQNDILKYFDTTEKLEKYIPQDMYFNIKCRQIKSFEETTKFLPVWIVTNLSAKNSFPLHENIFDLLVIDEASQCDIASALPLLFRAKNIVIIGDPEQLKFITTLKTSTEQKIASTKGIVEYYSDAFSYCKNSIFDLSERTINTVNDPVIFLNEHYRCHKDIITYSNKYFYGEKLNILTDE